MTRSLFYQIFIMKTVTFGKFAPSVLMLALSAVGSVGHAKGVANAITDGTQLDQSMLSATKSPYGLDDGVLDELAGHVLWERLLLIKKGKSQVKDPDFFLADKSLKSELVANLFALQAGDKSVMCRFPARMAFLSDELGKRGIKTGYRDELCGDFLVWADGLDGQMLSLIFAEEHPNSLGSSYGHAFLRLDTTKSLTTGADKDAIAINYSSLLPDGKVNELARAVKSVVGVYDSGLEFFNYEQKKNDYTIKGERDIWQYEMDLTTQDVRQILRHLWETKDMNRPYFFTHDNCATEIVRLIDVVRADKDIAKDMGKIVIPAKVAQILKNNGMVKKTTFVPSNGTLRQAKLNNGANFDLAHLKPSRNDPVHASPTHRLGLTVGHDNHHGGADSGKASGALYGLSVRSAYQDLLDRPDGVREYLDLQILSGSLTYDKEKLKIDKATIFSSRSYNPINSAKNNPNPTTGKPKPAWGLHLTLEQATDSSSRDNHDHLVFNTQIEYGKSWVIGQAEPMTGELADTLCYVLGGAGGQLGRVNQGYRAGVQVLAGCHRRLSDDFRLTGELVLPYWYHHDKADNRSGYIQPSVKVAMQYDLNRHHAIRLTTDAERLYDKTRHGASVAYMRYF